MKRLIVVVGIIAFLYPYSARADTYPLAAGVPVSSQFGGSNPPIPDVSGWKAVNISRIALRLSNFAMVYMGLEIKYNNPADPKEFMLVIRRHIPLPIYKPRRANERLLSEAAVELYVQKEEEDRLKGVADKTDPFLYVRWRTKEDPGTGQDKQDGDASFWFMPADGNWIFFQKEPVETEFLTENVGNGEPHNVFSGVSYQIDGVYHILRVDRSVLAKLLEEDR